MDCPICELSEQECSWLSPRTFSVATAEGDEHQITLSEMERNAKGKAGKAVRLLTWARAADVGATYMPGLASGYVVRRVA